MNPNWISAIANSIIALVNIIMAFTIFLAWKQIKADHERSRREAAIQLISSWVSTLTQRASAARKLVDAFTFDQAKALFNQEGFELDSKYSGLIDAALDSPP